MRTIDEMKSLLNQIQDRRFVDDVVDGLQSLEDAERFQLDYLCEMRRAESIVTFVFGESVKWIIADVVAEIATLSEDSFFNRLVAAQRKKIERARNLVATDPVAAFRLASEALDNAQSAYDTPRAIRRRNELERIAAEEAAHKAKIRVAEIRIRQAKQAACDLSGKHGCADVRRNAGAMILEAERELQDNPKQSNELALGAIRLCREALASSAKSKTSVTFSAGKDAREAQQKMWKRLNKNGFGVPSSASA